MTVDDTVLVIISGEDGEVAVECLDFLDVFEFLMFIFILFIWLVYTKKAAVSFKNRCKITASECQIVAEN